ncbi:MAG: DUF262 domain-containing HNH endonuclease family protein [Pseudomonadota bacterium]
MTQGLRAQESTLADLLRPGIELAMPPYQRSYSWDKNEAIELLNDLLLASEKSNGHFIGAIVLVREGSKLLIVDGQQRLTTITIVLAILRDLEPDPDITDELHGLIADEHNSVVDQQSLWRLSLNHIDGAFFRALVQIRDATLELDVEPNEGESQRRMRDNTEALVTELKKIGAERRRELIETIKERLLLVKVIVEDWDGGYNVFRVLNTRGKAPNSHDIIKTELLQRSNLSISEADTYSRQWSEHEAKLGGSGFDDLLNQIRVLYSRNSDTGPTGFRKAVLSKTSARQFLQVHLPAYVDAYVAISRGIVDFGPQTESISASLNHLRLLDHQLWRAPALQFLGRSGTDGEHADKFFKRLERFAFAMMLIVTERKQRVKRYGRIADAVDDPNYLLSDRGPLTLSRDEKKKIKTRLLGRFGSFGQRRAIALRLNGEIEGGVPLGPDGGATVEHVLPRNLPPSSAWHKSWPNAAVHRELCETIGNFVLLSDAANQRADNVGFDAKKALYFANGEPEFALTRDLADQLAWTPDVVRRRTAQLADILSATWELDG